MPLVVYHSRIVLNHYYPLSNASVQEIYMDMRSQWI